MKKIKDTKDITVITRARPIKTSWLLAAGIIILILVAWWVKARYLDQSTLITVVGRGSVLVRPEIVKMTVNVSTQGKTASLALDENRRLTQQIVNFLKEKEVGEGDIALSYARVLPPSPNLGRQDYQALNAINLTYRNLSQFDGFIKDLYSEGALSVTNIAFAVEKPEQLEKDVLEKALFDAKIKARQVAEVSEKNMGRTVSLEVVDGEETGVPVGQVAPENTFEGLISSLPSQIEFSREVSVVFELK